jgi:hypothetical protein
LPALSALADQLALAQPRHEFEDWHAREITVTAASEEAFTMCPSPSPPLREQIAGIRNLWILTVPNLNVTEFELSNIGQSLHSGIGLQDHLITTDPGVSVYIDGVHCRQIG